MAFCHGVSLYDKKDRIQVKINSKQRHKKVPDLVSFLQGPSSGRSAAGVQHEILSTSLTNGKRQKVATR